MIKTYDQHIFVCTNKRDSEEDRSCAGSGAEELFKYAKEQALKLNLKQKGIRLSSAGCLGNCKSGPVLVIYPEGRWYRYQNKNDIDEILSSIC